DLAPGGLETNWASASMAAARFGEGAQPNSSSEAARSEGRRKCLSRFLRLVQAAVRAGLTRTSPGTSNSLDEPALAVVRSYRRLFRVLVLNLYRAHMEVRSCVS